MRITVGELLAQHDRAREQWPFIDEVEKDLGLPPKLLYAVGSRETNLTNIAGDYGTRTWAPWNETSPRYHAYGVWQRDVQHGVTSAYLTDVHRQAVDAAIELGGWFHQFGSWKTACAGYNSGQPDDALTALGDYASDVMARLAVLQADRPAPPPPAPAPPAVGEEEFRLDASAAKVLQGITDLINQQGNVIIHGNRDKEGVPDGTHYGLDQLRGDMRDLLGLARSIDASLAKLLRPAPAPVKVAAAAPAPAAAAAPAAPVAAPEPPASAERPPG